MIEDLRQMVIAELYPDRFFDYLLCRAGHLKEAWTKCAQKVGLDIGKIAREIETEQTKQRFLEHVRRTFVPYTHSCQLKEGIYGIPSPYGTQRFWLELIDLQRRDLIESRGKKEGKKGLTLHYSNTSWRDL